MRYQPQYIIDLDFYGYDYSQRGHPCRENSCGFGSNMSRSHILDHALNRVAGKQVLHHTRTEPVVMQVLAAPPSERSRAEALPPIRARRKPPGSLLLQDAPLASLALDRDFGVMPTTWAPNVRVGWGVLRDPPTPVEMGALLRSHSKLTQHMRNLAPQHDVECLIWYCYGGKPSLLGAAMGHTASGFQFVVAETIHRYMQDPIFAAWATGSDFEHFIINQSTRFTYAFVRGTALVRTTFPHNIPTKEQMGAWLRSDPILASVLAGGERLNPCARAFVGNHLASGHATHAEREAAIRAVPGLSDERAAIRAMWKRSDLHPETVLTDY